MNKTKTSNKNIKPSFDLSIVCSVNGPLPVVPYGCTTLAVSTKNMGT